MPVVLTRATQQAAGYRPVGGIERCAYCRFYGSANNCGRILGPVSPAGWCRFFSRMIWLRMDGGDTDMGILGPPGVTMDLSFMSSGTLPPSVTFIRASTASYFNATGTMQTAAANTPRWDYNPSTLALNGLLIEEPRTNALLNSATLGTQSVAVTAQAYTLSFYGAGTITKSGTATGALVGTGAFPQRVSQTFTPTAGTLTLTVTGTVQNAQLEAGAFPTSYIPTTSAAVTRSADVATIASIPGRNAAAETFAAEFLLVTSQRSGCSILGDAATPNYQMIYLGAGLNVGCWDGGAVTTANNLTLGAVAKAAANWVSPNPGSICLNAGTVASSATMTHGYGAVTTVKLMGDGSGTTDTANGYIRRFRYWPRVLTNTEMQQVTT